MSDTISRMPTIAKLRIASRVMIVAALFIGVGYVRNIYLPTTGETCHSHLIRGQCHDSPADYMTSAELFIASLKFAGLELLLTILLCAACVLVLFAWPANDSISECG